MPAVNVCEMCGGDLSVEGERGDGGEMEMGRVALCLRCHDVSNDVHPIELAWSRASGGVVKARGRTLREQARALNCPRYWEVEGTPVVVAQKWSGDLIAFKRTSDGYVDYVHLSPDYWLYVDHYKT